MNQHVKGYSEIRGTLIKKKRSIFGNYCFCINDGTRTVSVIVGKGLFDWDFYHIGMKLTVGYIGYINHALVNIRPGIVENED